MNLSNTLKKIKIIKYALILMLCVITYLLIINMFNRDSIKEKSEEEIGNMDNRHKATQNNTAYSLNITNSVLNGYSKNNEPYKIIANKVNQLDEGEYDLNEVFAKYNLRNKKCTIQSEDATLYDKDGYIFLKNGVKVTLGDAILMSDVLEFNLGNHDSKSNSPVKVESKGLKITSDRFSTKNSTDILYFNGNVISCFSK